MYIAKECYVVREVCQFGAEGLNIVFCSELLISSKNIVFRVYDVEKVKKHRIIRI